MTRDIEKMDSGCIFELNEPDKDVNVQAKERICGKCCYYEQYLSGKRGKCQCSSATAYLWSVHYYHSGCPHWTE